MTDTYTPILTDAEIQNMIRSFKGRPIDDLGVVREIERVVIEAYQRQQWRPIDTAPHETLVALGWRDESGVFKQEIALASAGKRYPGGASDMWWHGRATHWLPLPPPPEQQ